MTDHTQDLKALLESIDARVKVYEGRVPATATGPAVALHGGIGDPTARRVDGQAYRATQTWLANCSSNTAAGARLIANRVVDTVDGTRLAGTLLAVPYVGPLIEDRDDPSDYRWSITVEIRHHTSRR